MPIIVVVLDQYLWIKRKYIQSYQYKLCGIYCTVGYCCCNVSIIVDVLDQYLWIYAATECLRENIQSYQ